MNISAITIVRFLHIAAALFNLAYVYTPLHTWPHGIIIVQYLSMPLLIITGALMVRRRKLAHKAHM